MSHRGHCAGREGQKELMKLLENDGWYRIAQGATSHIHFKHPSKPGKITVPRHPTTNTYLSILRQAGLKHLKNQS